MEIVAPLLPVSQLTPVNPVEQEHSYVVPVTVQIPLTQGLLSHGVISETASMGTHGNKFKVALHVDTVYNL